MKNQIHFGKSLQDWILQHNIPVHDLATGLGSSARTISRLFHRPDTKLSTAIKATNFLGPQFLVLLFPAFQQIQTEQQQTIDNLQAEIQKLQQENNTLTVQNQVLTRILPNQRT